MKSISLITQDTSYIFPTVSTILPSPIFYTSSYIGAKNKKTLLPEEALLIEGANNKREKEFCAGRYCAHNIMNTMGFYGFPILKDKNGAPIWPKGTTGSITHSGNLAAATASTTERIKSVGLDIQKRVVPFPPNVVRILYRADEIDAFKRIPPKLLDLYSCCIFSAKESVFKSCYMAFKFLPDFSDIFVELNLTKGIFHATVPELQKNKTFSFCDRMMGHVGFDMKYVYTATWLESNTNNLNC